MSKKRVEVIRIGSHEVNMHRYFWFHPQENITAIELARCLVIKERLSGFRNLLNDMREWVEDVATEKGVLRHFVFAEFDIYETPSPWDIKINDENGND